MKVPSSRPSLVLHRDELLALLRLYGREIRAEDLRRWSQAAGGFFDAGEDGVDLLRLLGWAILRRGGGTEATSPYQRHRERVRLRQMEQSRLSRDIGELPAVVDPARKARAERDFRLFCEAYFPQTFYLPWSRDHLKVVAKIEQAVLEGGLFAMAMPRGSGNASANKADTVLVSLPELRNPVSADVDRKQRPEIESRLSE